MRLIDGDALMDLYANRLELLCERYGPDSSECGVLAGAMKLLEAQPTIEERKTEWIPCSERLPEADERVLVTTDGYDYYVWDCMPNRGDNYFWEDESGFYHDKHEVIAWMPLPAPYQGEGDSNDRQM